MTLQRLPIALLTLTLALSLPDSTALGQAGTQGERLSALRERLETYHAARDRELARLEQLERLLPVGDLEIDGRPANKFERDMIQFYRMGRRQVLALSTYPVEAHIDSVAASLIHVEKLREVGRATQADAHARAATEALDSLNETLYRLEEQVTVDAVFLEPKGAAGRIERIPFSRALEDRRALHARLRQRVRELEEMLAQTRAQIEVLAAGSQRQRLSPSELARSEEARAREAAYEWMLRDTVVLVAALRTSEVDMPAIEEVQGRWLTLFEGGAPDAVVPLARVDPEQLVAELEALSTELLAQSKRMKEPLPARLSFDGRDATDMERDWIQKSHYGISKDLARAGSRARGAVDQYRQARTLAAELRRVGNPEAAQRQEEFALDALAPPPDLSGDWKNLRRALEPRFLYFGTAGPRSGPLREALTDRAFMARVLAEGRDYMEVRIANLRARDAERANDSGQRAERQRELRAGEVRTLEWRLRNTRAMLEALEAGRMDEIERIQREMWKYIDREAR